MQKNAKNFVIWAALNSGNVKFFCEEPSYYGGVEGFDKKQYSAFCQKYGIKEDSHFEWSTETDENILKQILNIGVDYDATEEFVSTDVSKFEGTFCDSSTEDIVKGTLVLKDGKQIDMFAVCKIDTQTFEQMDKFYKFFVG